MQEYLEIGMIVNTFGIKGFVKVNPYTDDVKRFDELSEVYLLKDKERKTYEIEEVKYQKHVVLLKLKGVDTIEEAEKLRNYSVKVDRKHAVKLPENTYFIVDLIGLQVKEESGEILGNIVDVFSTKSNDVYVVKDNLGKQILIPAIKEVVKMVDMEHGNMIVHLLEGLR